MVSCAFSHGWLLRFEGCVLDYGLGWAGLGWAELGSVVDACAVVLLRVRDIAQRVPGYYVTICSNVPDKFNVIEPLLVSHLFYYIYSVATSFCVDADAWFLIPLLSFPRKLSCGFPGGALVLLGAEVVRGKRLSRENEELVQYVGYAMLILAAIWLFTRDLDKLALEMLVKR
jgi:hypothetical protein